MVKRGFGKSSFLFGIIIFLIIVNVGGVLVDALITGRVCEEEVESGVECDSLTGCMCYQETSSSYLYCADLNWDNKGYVWITYSSLSELTGFSTCGESSSCYTVEYISACLLPELTCWYDNIADGGSGWKWTYTSQISTETEGNACYDLKDNDCDTIVDECSVELPVCDNDNSCEPERQEDCGNCADCSCLPGQNCQDGVCIKIPSPTDCPDSVFNLVWQSCGSWAGGCSCSDPNAPEYPLFCGKFSGSSTYTWFPLDPYCGTRRSCRTIDFTHGTCTWNDAVCWYDNIADEGEGWRWTYDFEVPDEESGNACYDNYDNDCDTVTDECAAPVCELTSAKWKNLAGASITSANVGDLVRLNVEVTTQCIGQKVSFKIYEDDWIGDDIISGIVSITLTSTSGFTTWIVNWTEDNDFLESNPPEYYFRANVSENVMDSNVLTANPSTTSCPSGIASGTSCQEWMGYCYCGSYSFYCGNYSNQGWKWFTSAPTCNSTTSCKIINYTHGTCDWENAVCWYDNVADGGIGWRWTYTSQISTEIGVNACNDNIDNDCDGKIDGLDEGCSGGVCTDTCSSLGYECGTATVCGISTNCGSCSSGYTCQSGVCVATSTCDLLSAKWNTTTNANVRDLMKLSVIGNSGCVGKTITFKVYEDDLYPLPDTQVYTPTAITIGSANNFTTWTVTWMDDGALQGNPEYYFIATVSGTTESVKSSNLNINDYTPPPADPFCGDGICTDGVESCLNCVADCGECPVECTIISASWNETSVIEGTPVKLNIQTSNCNGKTASFVIKEDDSPGIDDNVITNPSNVQISSINEFSTWDEAEFQEDTELGESNPPEYYFTVTVDGKNKESSPRLLIVTEDPEEWCDLNNINFCSNYLIEGECEWDICEVGEFSVPDTILCGDGYDCGCYWDEDKTPKCNPYWDESSCGDGIEQSGEECDDGNNVNLDGCSSDCKYEISDPPCGIGLTLCKDGTCSLNCDYTDAGAADCDYDGTCDTGEGCTCSDCDGEQDTCATDLVCSLADTGCCNTVSDNYCDIYCSFIDPDCKGGVGGGGGTCFYTEESDDTCKDDGLLSRFLIALWSGNLENEECVDIEDTIICPASVRVPFFGIYSFILAVILIALIYIIYFQRKKNNSKKKGKKK